MYSFPNLELVLCSMSSSNCCFLTCIQVLQVVGKAVWYSHLLKNFPQFVVIHSQSFHIVNETEVDVLLKLSCFFYDPTDVGNLISNSSAFSKSSLYIWKFLVHILLKPSLENFQHYFGSMWGECNFGIWNSSTRIPSPPLYLFIVMLPKTQLALCSRMSDSGSDHTIVVIWVMKIFLCTVLLCILVTSS